MSKKDPSFLFGTHKTACLSAPKYGILRLRAVKSRQKMLMRVCTPFADAARTPHGDSNVYHAQAPPAALLRCSPHPSRGQQRHRAGRHRAGRQMQPAPLTGTATHRPSARRAYRSDAARTPHGDKKRRRHTRFCVTPSFLLSRGGLKPL